MNSSIYIYRLIHVAYAIANVKKLKLIVKFYTY